MQDLEIWQNGSRSTHCLSKAIKKGRAELKLTKSALTFSRTPRNAAEQDILDSLVGAIESNLASGSV